MKLYTYLLIGSLIILASGCAKDDGIRGVNYGNGGGSGGININSPWQFSITMDGTTYTKSENDTNVEGIWINSQTTNNFPDSSIKNYNSMLVNWIGSISYFEVNRNGHKFLGSFPEDSLVEQYIMPGTYDYSMTDVDGISIRWWDDQGIPWGTDQGPADQTGSVFTIDQVQVDTNFIDYTIKVLAHFNCTLYNGVGESKTVTNGVFVGSFQNYW